MHTFEFVRPADAATAVATAAQANTAQQGADVRFVAGGTTLLDLMKLNVETPARVIDINRLPLDQIEATPDGGLQIGATTAAVGRRRQPRCPGSAGVPIRGGIGAATRAAAPHRSGLRPPSPQGRRGCSPWPSRAGTDETNRSWRRYRAHRTGRSARLRFLARDPPGCGFQPSTRTHGRRDTPTQPGGA